MIQSTVLWPFVVDDTLGAEIGPAVAVFVVYVCSF